MGVIENMREVADLVKKIGDIELNRKIKLRSAQHVEIFGPCPYLCCKQRCRSAERKSAVMHASQWPWQSGFLQCKAILRLSFDVRHS